MSLFYFPELRLGGVVLRDPIPANFGREGLIIYFRISNPESPYFLRETNLFPSDESPSIYVTITPPKEGSL